jgi:hypothetical protein
MASIWQSGPRDIAKRRYWGLAGFIGAVAGLVGAHFTKYDVLIVAGMVAGLIGGLVVAATRGSDEI